MKTMSECMNDLTGSSLDNLEQIVTLQYRKFVRFYKLIEKYSGIIKKVHYEFNSPSSLDVELTFDTKKSLESIKKELDDEMTKKEYSGSTLIKKKSILISIVLDETDTKKKGSKSK